MSRLINRTARRKRRKVNWRTTKRGDDAIEVGDRSLRLSFLLALLRPQLSEFVGTLAPVVLARPFDTHRQLINGGQRFGEQVEKVFALATEPFRQHGFNAPVDKGAQVGVEPARSPLRLRIKARTHSPVTALASLQQIIAVSHCSSPRNILHPSEPAG